MERLLDTALPACCVVRFAKRLGIVDMVCSEVYTLCRRQRYPASHRLYQLAQSCR